MNKYRILINSHAGSVINLGEEDVYNAIYKALGEQYIHEIIFLKREELQESFNVIDSTYPLLIGGGDGTLLTAAGIFKKRNMPFGILPFGTMNLLCQDIGLSPNFIKAARAYRGSRVSQYDIAAVNGEIFLCNIMIGIFPALARMREAKRHESGLMKWGALFQKTMGRLSFRSGDLYTFHHENQKDVFQAKAVIVSNNIYCNIPGAGNAFKKETLKGGKLGVYLVKPEGTLESVHLLYSLAVGNWHEDEAITSFESSELVLKNHSKKIRVLLDGEGRLLTAPLSFETIPQGISLIVPKNIHKLKEEAV